jgi:hypothetical protein
MKSKSADLKNSGKDRYGGASKGAAFLEYFIDKDKNWVHLDIAGPASTLGPGDCVSEGATGFGTQLVLKYLFNYSMKGTDVKEEDLKSPLEKALPNANANLTEQVKEQPTSVSDNNVDVNVQVNGSNQNDQKQNEKIEPQIGQATSVTNQRSTINEEKESKEPIELY